LLTAEQLRKLCISLRRDRRPTDEMLTSMIEAEVERYRILAAEPRPQLPPPELLETLPLIGWLIYEASLEALWRVAPAYERLSAEERNPSEVAAALVTRLANAARQLPWPEFAPRALGAIRAEALLASKKDTEIGYDEAWILHQEAKLRYNTFADSHAHRSPSDPYVLGLDETLLQLILAETGTACRTTERVVARWAEGLELPSPTWSASDESRWTQRMFSLLNQGVLRGEMALDTAARVDRVHGLVRKVTEHRMALTTAYQNPGIMTARAILLMIAMSPEMQRLGRRPMAGTESWGATRRGLLARFERAYRDVERPVLDEHGSLLPLIADHARSLVWLRLNLALLIPGYDLPARITFDPCLKVNPLDDNAVNALSAWLAKK
jgi:hypothetical protein